MAGSFWVGLRTGSFDPARGSLLLGLTAEAPAVLEDCTTSGGCDGGGSGGPLLDGGAATTAVLSSTGGGVGCRSSIFGGAGLVAAGAGAGAGLIFGSIMAVAAGGK